jgi:hypothetical protein
MDMQFQQLPLDRFEVEIEDVHKETVIKEMMPQVII